MSPARPCVSWLLWAVSAASLSTEGDAHRNTMLAQELAALGRRRQESVVD